MFHRIHILEIIKSSLSDEKKNLTIFIVFALKHMFFEILSESQTSQSSFSLPNHLLLIGCT